VPELGLIIHKGTRVASVKSRKRPGELDSASDWMSWHAGRTEEFRSPIVRGMARPRERARDRGRLLRVGATGRDPSTTGKPNGVMISQRSACHRLQLWRGCWTTNADRNLLLPFSNFSFPLWWVPGSIEPPRHLRRPIERCILQLISE
jgi:hypothetical protein